MWRGGASGRGAGRAARGAAPNARARPPDRPHSSAACASSRARLAWLRHARRESPFAASVGASARDARPASALNAFDVSGRFGRSLWERPLGSLIIAKGHWCGSPTSRYLLQAPQLSFVGSCCVTVYSIRGIADDGSPSPPAPRNAALADLGRSPVRRWRHPRSSLSGGITCLTLLV